jgi:hypothetical protein
VQNNSEVERAIALAVAELLAHGGTAEQINELISQFRVIENAEKFDIEIPSS